MSYNYTVLDALGDVEREHERLAREQADRPDVVNVEGRVYEVGPDGDLTGERDRAELAALAQHRADTCVRIAIGRHNRQVHPTKRVEQREASPAEVATAYRQLLADGRHRAETGQSGDGVDLGDVLAR